MNKPPTVEYINSNTNPMQCKILLKVLIFCFIFCGVLMACQKAQSNEFKVIKVSDGDTITVEINGFKSKIRLAKIDCPEKNQPWGITVKTFVTYSLLNKTISLKQYGFGSYNRPICEVFIIGVNFNLLLIKKGLAEVYKGKNKGNIKSYIKAEKLARSKKMGIWSDKDYISPGIWRKKKRSKK